MSRIFQSCHIPEFVTFVSSRLRPLALLEAKIDSPGQNG